MPEAWFYQLTATPLEQILPDLLEKTLGRGWKALLRFGSPEAMARIDAALWTCRDDAFLPHGTSGTDHPEWQPIYLTLGPENPNAANLLMLLDGARSAPAEMAAFERTCLVFNGNDPAERDAARLDWRAVKAAGLDTRYWAEENGRWIQKT